MGFAPQLKRKPLGGELMQSQIPQLARSWTIGTFAVLMAVMTWGVVASHQPLWAHLLFLGFLVLLAYAALSILSTKLTNEGVSQRTWRGWTNIRWEDVRSVRFKGKGAVDVAGPEGRVRIPGPFYTDYDGLLAWLAERLPHAWPR